MESKIIRKNIPLLRLIQALNLTMKHLQNVPVRAVNVQVFLFFFFSVKRIWLVTITTLSMRVSEHWIPCSEPPSCPGKVTHVVLVTQCSQYQYKPQYGSCCPLGKLD